MSQRTDCLSDFSCPVNPVEASFETYFRIDFGQDIGTFLDDDLVQRFPEVFSQAYDNAAGVLCDPCRRHVTEAEIAYVPEPVTLLSGDEVLVPTNYFIVKATIEQSGNCETALDNVRGSSLSINNLNSFSSSCPDGFILEANSPTTRQCCCSCNNIANDGLSAEAFQTALGLRFGLSLENVVELSEDSRAYGTSRYYSTELFPLYACFDSFWTHPTMTSFHLSSSAPSIA